MQSHRKFDNNKKKNECLRAKLELNNFIILGILSLLIGGFLVMASVRELGIADCIPLITGGPFILFWKMIKDVYKQIKRDNKER